VVFTSLPPYGGKGSTIDLRNACTIHPGNACFLDIGPLISMTDKMENEYAVRGRLRGAAAPTGAHRAQDWGSAARRPWGRTRVAPLNSKRAVQ
jgi:hypothetical protein